MKRLVGAAFVVLLLVACRGSSSPLDGPVKCERDTDCNVPTCGPCTSGSTYTQADMNRECVVSVCFGRGGPDPVAFCNNHVCTIR